MAPLFLLTLLLSSLHPSPAQVIISSSPSSPQDLPINPPPTNQTAPFLPSSPPRGRPNVPVKVAVQDTTNATQQKQRPVHPTVQSSPSFIARLTTQNLLTQPTAWRPRTDTAGLVSVLPTSASDVLDSAAGPQKEAGSGSLPTVISVEEESPASQMAQYRPHAQTAISLGPSSKASPTDSQTLKPRLSAPTTANRVSTTPPPDTRAPEESPVVTQATPPTLLLTDRITWRLDEASPRSTVTTVTGRSLTSPQPSAMTRGGTSNLTTTRQAETTSSSTSSPPTPATHPERTTTTSTTVQSTRTGPPHFLITSVVPVAGTRSDPTFQTGAVQKNRSFPLGRPHQAPSSPASTPPPSPSINLSPNGTLLHWDELSRTLAYAWELHVYGSASLFLLLFAGAALGLSLSPGLDCPHRGALALSNALLFLAGGLRAALFLIDPYGTRRFLPRPAVTALYNLPLHLLVWAEAALALLSLRVAGVSVLPSTLERPPLVAVLAVLQCTLLLAADLLSPALSPAVPVTLQVLSLCWGLALCLGFLCYVFPRLRCPALPHPGAPEARTKAWTGSGRTGLVLGRVLAACALLGALCCGLHLHATLWLYGLLGDWRRFNWGWWLMHFWSRLLELAWGFSLLLLGSWVFWRPRDGRGAEEGGAGDGRAAGDLPSPGQSAGSTHRHTCWSKIVQSLRGKPCKKSESNGVGGGGAGGGSGEVPNNWAGQERPGADISKSLIRNQNHEQAVTQPRCVKDSNRDRNQRGPSERGLSDGSTGSLLRLQVLGRPPQRSLSVSLDQDGDAGLSLYDFDLRPPSPMHDLTRSIDEALHREHLLGTGSLFQPFSPLSPGSGVSQGPWLRRNSDPQMLSDSSEAHTESSMPLGGSVLSSVPSRQVTAPPTPSHQGHRWADGAGSVPSSVSCPVSLRPSAGHLGEDVGDDTRPFITPDSETLRGRAARPAGSRSYLEVSRHDDSASVSSEIIDL